MIHVFGTLAVSFVLALLALPASVWMNLLRSNADAITPSAFVLHLTLSLAIWLLLFFVFKKRERKVRVIKLSRGSVMLETLVIMPLFFLLSFGTAQLSINNVAGILANVAVYQAARAIWVWSPETSSQEKRAEFGEDFEIQKAKTAVAMVMIPVAPGDYFAGSLEGDETTIAEKARLAAAASHIPAGGVLTDFLGGQTLDGLVTVGSQGYAGLGSNPLDYLTFYNALGSGDFMLRTLNSFSLAYNSTKIEYDEETLEVTMTYEHFQGMPFVGRIFGEKTWTDGATLRPGYYTTFKRVYGFEKQASLPNAKLPQNRLLSIPSAPTTDDYQEGL